MATTLDGVDMGYVQSDRTQGNTGITVVSGVTGASTENEAVKILSASKSFEVQGVVTGDLSTLQAFAAAFDAWIEGDSLAVVKRTFVSPMWGTKTVTVLEGDAEWKAGTPGKIEYSIRLSRIKA